MVPSSDAFDGSDGSGSLDVESATASHGDDPGASDGDVGRRETVRALLGVVGESPVAVLGGLALVSLIPASLFVQRATIYPEGAAFAVLAWIALAVVLRRRAPLSDVLWKLGVGAVLYLWLLPWWVRTVELGHLPGAATTAFVTVLPLVFTVWAVRSV